ncbi:type 1 glutamine amidotransferase [Pararhizobium gei]|uniref:type 1 glutamine amidotransferase n=1 Tax=Pararhizobium gei TaxID=1395951 RepID=UPI0023D9A7D7|nr:type 1 glutamine amidotransferase [Rhizobium gei]
MRVLIVENMEHSDLGQVGVALSETNAEIDLRQPFKGEMLPSSVWDHDALVVFGGEQSAIDDDIHPYLPDLAALMRAFCEADKSVLGICLGSQLLARGHGARNIIGHNAEFGWHEVKLSDAGRGDPVLGAASAAFPIFQWHSDTFTLPENATLLATGPAVENQAFRIGRAAYGMQFHFEAGKRVVEDWNRVFRDQILRLDPAWLDNYDRHAARHADRAEEAGLALARAWVKTIRTGARTDSRGFDEISAVA